MGVSNSVDETEAGKEQMNVKSLTIVVATALSCALFLSLNIAGASQSKTEAYLLSLPAHHSDVGEIGRTERLSEIAEAIDVATGDKTERAMLLALGWYESRWQSAVGSGERLGDAGKAYGYFQSWEQDRSNGVDGQVKRALSHLRRAGNYCVAQGYDRHLGAFSLYGSGTKCGLERSKKRVAMANRILRKL